MDRSIAHYKLLERIGGGGMGVVFRAEDTKLKRLVAIKLLPPGVVDDPDTKERFLREARAASALDHPNICTIHEIDETEDHQLFLVMAHYEGETLAEKLRRGSLPISEATNFARQLLAGLARAHEAGIIHRDIKPGNIMITRRQELKILDFSLAKFLGQTELTDPGAILGTMLYMSPEQASGRELDQRSDLWSAGVVLYEMLTGRRPFKGSSYYAITRSILNDEVPPVYGFSERILSKALAKQPGARYQSAREFLDDLDGMLASTVEPTTVTRPRVTPGPGEQSILVLPFVNLQADREADYFSDGLTDEIITDLSSVRSLRVISRTSAIRAKAMAEDIQKLTRELQVRYVLEGTVRKSGNNLRVTAKLVDALTDSVLWADKYGGTLEDVFSIQETLSRKIVGALEVKLTPDEDQVLAQRSIADVRAYECYFKAKQEILSYSREGLERALDYLQRAIGIVGDNILLISALGQVYWQFINAGITKDPAYLKRARECADRILALDSESPHGHRLLGMLQLSQGNFQEGLRGLKRALAKQPNDTDTLGWLIAIYAYSGKPHAATSFAKKLLEIDPLTPIYRCLPGLLALMAGEFGPALGPFAESVAMDPTNPALRFCYAHVLALNGRSDEAVQAFEVLAKDMPDNFFARLGLFYKHALQGEKEPALHASTEDLKTAASADPYYCWNMAQGYALVNERTEALDWLERALSAGFINYPLLAQMDPFLGNVRGEPRFEQLMNIAKERWEAFEV